MQRNSPALGVSGHGAISTFAGEMIQPAAWRRMANHWDLFSFQSRQVIASDSHTEDSN